MEWDIMAVGRIVIEFPGEDSVIAEAPDGRTTSYPSGQLMITDINMPGGVPDLIEISPFDPTVPDCTGATQLAWTPASGGFAPPPEPPPPEPPPDEPPLIY